METLTISPVQQGTLNAQLAMYDLHTLLFNNVLDSMTDKDAHNRLGTKANHPAWLAGSLVQERFAMANVLGVDKTQQKEANDLFKDHAGIKDGVTYPSLDSYREDWNLISPLLRHALANATPDQLNGPDPFGMGEDMKLLDVMTYCMDRESYCIGQLGLFRRLLGYPAMRYQ
ncbi:DinB family protein [Chitinophaga barathri]|uniref:DinB family protein n=1 Tax=Chitinophaga barathri TaxID=1647451 RepID=A0A3N4MAI5_9BACT|nr:DinB family protein [Chitinophaga barathri]RPD40581.1 DinB family protein [Chitinophaga barathri]